MITLKPDKNIKKRFGKHVDFDTLGLVFSLLYNSHLKRKRGRSYTLVIRMAKGSFSYFAEQPHRKTMRIAISEDIQSPTIFQATLAHEFRHFIQDVIFKISWNEKTYDDSTYQKYRNSPCEVDAALFDYDIGRKTIRLYNRLTKFKKLVSVTGGYKPKR